MFVHRHKRRWAGAALAASLLACSAVAAAAGGAGDMAGSVSVLKLRPDMYMLTVGGVNVGVETGPQGVIVVDSGPAAEAKAMLATIRKLSAQPIRYVIDTSADPQLTGGNAVLSDAGLSLEVGWLPLLQAANKIENIKAIDSKRAPIIARLGVVDQMVKDSKSVNSESIPTDTFTRQYFNFQVNGQAIQVVAVPPAHTSADSVVLFRGPNVVVTGAVFDDTHFPVIDLKNGGSINGEIAAVNQVMNTLVVPDVPVVSNSGGTWIIPLRGPVCNQDDLVTFRDMLFAIRNRVQFLIKQGKNLEQVEAADPAQGFKTRYGSDTGSWTTKDFIDAVYRSLKSGKHIDARSRG